MGDKKRSTRRRVVIRRPSGRTTTHTRDSSGRRTVTRSRDGGKSKASQLAEKQAQRNPADIRAGIEAGEREMTLAGQTTGTEKQQTLVKAYKSAVERGDKRGAELAQQAYANETRRVVEAQYGKQARKYSEAASKAIAGTATSQDYKVMARIAGKSVREIKKEQSSLKAVQTGSKRAGDVVRASRLVSPGQTTSTIQQISQAQQTPPRQASIFSQTVGDTTYTLKGTPLQESSIEQAARTPWSPQDRTPEEKKTRLEKEQTSRVLSAFGTVIARDRVLTSGRPIDIKGQQEKAKALVTLYKEQDIIASKTKVSSLLDKAISVAAKKRESYFQEIAAGSKSPSSFGKFAIAATAEQTGKFTKFAVERPIDTAALSGAFVVGSAAAQTARVATARVAPRLVSRVATSKAVKYGAAATVTGGVTAIEYSYAGTPSEKAAALVGTPLSFASFAAAAKVVSKRPITTVTQKIKFAEEVPVISEVVGESLVIGKPARVKTTSTVKSVGLQYGTRSKPLVTKITKGGISEYKFGELGLKEGKTTAKVLERVPIKGAAPKKREYKLFESDIDEFELIRKTKESSTSPSISFAIEDEGLIAVKKTFTPKSLTKKEAEFELSELAMRAQKEFPKFKFEGLPKTGVAKPPVKTKTKLVDVTKEFDISERIPISALKKTVSPSTDALGFKIQRSVLGESYATEFRGAKLVEVAAPLRMEKGLKVKKPLFEVEGLTLKEQKTFTKIVDIERAKEAGVTFGTATTSQLPTPWQKTPLGDIDIWFPKSEKATEKIVARIGTKLQKAKIDVRIGQDKKSLELVKTGEKIFEAKSQQVGLGEQTVEGFAGFRFSFDDTVPFGRGEATKAGEQLAKKASASGFFQPPSKDLPQAFGEGGLLPKAKRFKDLPDFFAQSKGVIEISKKSINPFKREAARKSEVALKQYFKTFTPVQQQEIVKGVQATVRGGTKIKLDLGEAIKEVKPPKLELKAVKFGPSGKEPISIQRESKLKKPTKEKARSPQIKSPTFKEGFKIVSPKSVSRKTVSPLPKSVVPKSPKAKSPKAKSPVVKSPSMKSPTFKSPTLASPKSVTTSVSLKSVVSPRSVTSRSLYSTKSVTSFKTTTTIVPGFKINTKPLKRTTRRKTKEKKERKFKYTPTLVGTISKAPSLKKQRIFSGFEVRGT